MEKQHPITDRLSLYAAQVRLIAGLIVAGYGLQEVESGAFALMLQDLAVRLEQMTAETERCLVCPGNLAEEGRPGWNTAITTQGGPRPGTK